MLTKSNADTLYQQIKQDIRDNKLPLNTALKQEQMSKQYSVSRIPIRDVLQRLKSEGWLVQSGKCGVKINPLNASDAEDLYIMRAFLEPLLLGHAMAHINHQLLGQAMDILEQLQQSQLTIQAHGDLNWQFHACLYQAANRPMLFNNVSHLHQQCSRYIGFQSIELNYQDNSEHEHYQLLEAIKTKQASKAKLILEKHIKEAGQALVAYLTSNQI